MPWSTTPEKRARDAVRYGHAWRKRRAAQLRAEPYCRIQGPSCTGRATEVDHIIGADADPGHQHLRSVCATCHRKRTAAEQGLGYRSGGSRSDPEPRANTVW